jgi:hypothetical protein
MAYKYLVCEITLKNGKDILYTADLSEIDGKDKEIEGEISTDELADTTIHRLIEWASKKNDACTREDFLLLGIHLYNKIFHDEKIRKHFEGVIDDFKSRCIKEKDSQLRLRVILNLHDKSGELKNYPWEFLAIPVKEDNIPMEKRYKFLAGELVPKKVNLILTRLHPDAEMIPNIEPEDRPLRILVVFCHPKGKGELKGEDVEKVIEDLKKLEESHDIIVKDYDDPSFSEVKTLLGSDGFRPHIFHFIGHGEPGKIIFKKDQEDLIAEQKEAEEAGRPTYNICSFQEIDIANFTGLFAEHTPTLVFLQACSGAEGDPVAFTNVARELTFQADIPSVIAMQYEIPVKEASIFTRKVYKEIERGVPIGEAVTKGRYALGRSPSAKKGLWGDRSFATPVIYLQAEQTIINPVDRGTVPESQVVSGADGMTPYEFKQHVVQQVKESTLRAETRKHATIPLYNKDESDLDSPKGHGRKKPSDEIPTAPEDPLDPDNVRRIEDEENADP